MGFDLRQAAKRVVYLLLLGLGVMNLYAQAELSGELRGNVLDPQGFAIHDAQVTLKNPQTGWSRDVRTDDAGVFIFPKISAGSYALTIRALGFETVTYSDVTVHLNEVRALPPAKLKVGATRDVVTVTGESTSVTPRETALRGTVDEMRLQELPLNGRDF